MRYSFLWSVLWLSVAACSQDKTAAADTKASQVLLASDFENLEGWVPENASLTTEKAHSGTYSIKVGPANEFSLTYISKLGRLSTTRLNKVRLKGWYFLTKPGPAYMVVQVVNPDANGTNAFYEKVTLDKVGAWTEVEQALTLPPALDPASQVRLYLWRSTATDAAYLDDVQLITEP